MIEAYPLQWPQGQPRTPEYQRRCAPFNTSQNAAQIGIMDEIKRMGGKSPIISTMIRVRNDGLPYAQQGRITDPGVAVYFTYNGKQMCFACDKWDTIGDNMQAIRKTIEALRGIARWGSGDMMERAFTGFAALPPPTASRAWWEVLGCFPDNHLADIENMYRQLAMKCHPDAPGGTHEKMAELNKAIDQARKAKS